MKYRIFTVNNFDFFTKPTEPPLQKLYDSQESAFEDIQKYVKYPKDKEFYIVPVIVVE